MVNIRTCVIIFILATLADIGQCCKCLVRTPSENDKLFCSSQFAAIVRIQAKSNLCPDENTCYPIRIQNLIRGDKHPTILETPSSSAACGLTNLFPGVYLIVSNIVHPLSVRMISCDLYVNITDIAIRKKVVKHYHSLKCSS